jgi:osmotically-inducible protein OsmY
MKTDAQLQQDVMAELKWKPYIDATAIGVEVKDGIVTLSGHVDNYDSKWRAERIAQNVLGVKGLTLDLKVNLASDHIRDDVDIARTALNVLAWTSVDLANDKVKVLVEKGWVTLSGQVKWEFQRRAANKAVRSLMGVTGVSNQISLIRPTVALADVESSINAALKRLTSAEFGRVHIVVNGNDVVLSGYVHSWAERSLVVHNAWAVPGVHNVIDNIAITT